MGWGGELEVGVGWGVGSGLGGGEWVGGWGVGGWGEKWGVSRESLKRLNYQFGFLVIISLIIPRSSVFTSKWRCFIARDIAN